jgi:hypothetical protein
MTADTPPVEPQAPSPSGPGVAQNPTVAPGPTQAQAPGRGQRAAVATLHQLERVLVWAGAQLMRPKIRSVVVGLLLVLIGAFVIDHSVWTFPIVIVGIVMIVVAWVGSRLEGRFGIEWSDQGAGFEMRARFKAANPPLLVAAPLPASTPPPPTTTATGSTTSTQSTATTATADDDGPTVIEGEAHTIEIDIAELKALIEAAELATATTKTTNGTHVSWRESSAGIDRGLDGAGG